MQHPDMFNRKQIASKIGSYKVN